MMKLSRYKNLLVGFFLIASWTFVLAQDSDTTAGKEERPVRPSELIRLLPRRTPNPIQPTPEVRALIEKFFETVKTGDSTKAYEDLLLNTRLAERKENVHLLIDKTDQANAVYGKPLDFELYDNYTVGSGLMVLTYITKNPVQPLRWRFIFYRPEKTWGLIDLRVDDVLDDLIE